MEVDRVALFLGRNTRHRRRRTPLKASPLDEAVHYEAPLIMDVNGWGEGPEIPRVSGALWILSSGRKYPAVGIRGHRSTGQPLYFFNNINYSFLIIGRRDKA